jgi:predicted ester cyclase
MLRLVRFIAVLMLAIALANARARAQASAWAMEAYQLSTQKFRWMESGDTAALGRILHDHLRYIHSNGWIESRDDILQDLSDSTLVYHKVTVQGDTVAVVGSTAVVTGRGIFDVSLRGERYQFNLLYTEVYARERERWWLVQRHACKAL